MKVMVTVRMGGDSSVGIATGYGLGGSGRGSNPAGGEIFRTRPHRPWIHPAPCAVGSRSLSPGVKWPGRDIDRPTSSSAKVKEMCIYY